MNRKQLLYYLIAKSTSVGITFRDYLDTVLLTQGELSSAGGISSVSSNGVAVNYSSEGDPQSYVSNVIYLSDLYDTILDAGTVSGSCAIIVEMKDQLKYPCDQVYSDFSRINR